MSTALAHHHVAAAGGGGGGGGGGYDTSGPAAGNGGTNGHGGVTPNSNSSNDIKQNKKLNKEEAGGKPAEQQQQPQEEEPEVDIVINNVVCSFNVRCHLNLRVIATQGLNVEYRKENGMVTMKLRHPYTTASMWSSGKIACTGANSEAQARTAARKYARFLQKLGFNTRFTNYRVVNVLGTCTMPFAIKITQFSQEHREASYEPELHPGVTYRIRDPKATLKIFSTGSITITAPSVANIQAAVERIYPLVHKFRKPKTVEDAKLGANVPLPPSASAKKRKRGAAGFSGGGNQSKRFNNHHSSSSSKRFGDDDDEEDVSDDSD